MSALWRILGLRLTSHARIEAENQALRHQFNGRHHVWTLSVCRAVSKGRVIWARCRTHGIIGTGNLHDTAREATGDATAELRAEHFEKPAQLIVEQGALVDHQAAGGKQRAISMGRFGHLYEPH